MSDRLKSLFAGAACLLASLSPANAADRQVGGTIPLTTYLGQQWAFTARVQDHDETFLFDTGGGLTVITPPTAAETGCKPWGKITGFRMRGDRLDVQRCDGFALEANGLKLGVPTAGIWDFTAILPKDAPPLAGAVGLDAFAGKVVTIDFVNRQIVVETAKSLPARIRSAREVPVRFAREAGGLALVPYVPIETPSGRIWVEIDCGSDAPLMLGRHVAALFGLDPDKKGGQKVEVTLGGGIRMETSVALGDYIVDGDIGAPAMKTWVITLDLKRQRLWIKTGS